MAAARYWRLIGIETYAGGDLALSELHLYDAAGRADTAVTLTATAAPIAGALADLQDNNTATVCRFSGSAVRAAGFALRWDFGAGGAVDATGVRLGAAGASATFLASCTLEYSSDGAAWQGGTSFGRYSYPGAYAYTKAPVPGDFHFARVSLLLHFDGANGSKTFVDESPAPQTITGYGDAQISTVQSKWGGASLALDGGGDYLLTPSRDGLLFGASDFTLELWVRPATLGSNQTLVGKYGGSGNRAWDLLLLGTYAHFRFTANGTNDVLSINSPNLEAGVWNHVAVVRSGTTFTLYVNGVAGTAGTSSAAVYASTGPVSIGINQEGNVWLLTGHIDDLRITKDVARYTTNFAPPTEAYPGGPVGSGGTVFVPPTIHTLHPAADVAASSPVPAHSARAAPSFALARDVEFGGPGTIYGTTKTKGTPNLPTKARVVLQHQRSKLPVRETWSDPVTGAFVFTGIDTSQQFLVVAEDAEGHFRPVAANRLTPEVL